jgi:hypothetical protein
MSQSFDLLIEGMIEAIRSRILPQLSDDFVRGQAYGIIYALSGLKLSADWAIAPLRRQIELPTSSALVPGWAIRSCRTDRGFGRTRLQALILSDCVTRAIASSVKC